MCKVVAWCLAGLLMAPVTGWAQGKGKESKPETLVEWHFVGTKNFEKVKDLKTLREILALPETAALREVGDEGFARIVAARFTKTKPTNANPAIVALIKPLLPDLVESESYFQF